MITSIEYGDTDDLEDVMHLYTQAERDGINWLASRRPSWLGELRVRRINRQPFAIALTGVAGGHDSRAQFYMVDFRLLCVQEFSRMGLVGPAECAGRTNIEVFYFIVQRQRARQARK